MSSRTKTSGRVAAALAMGAFGATLLAPGVAQAATAVRSFPSPGHVKFEVARDTANGVRARITLVLDDQGRWSLDTHAYNGNIAWRNVTLRCHLGPGWHGGVTFSSSRFRLGGHDSTDRTWTGQDTQAKLDYASYVGSGGYGTCDVTTG